MQSHSCTPNVTAAPEPKRAAASARWSATGPLDAAAKGEQRRIERVLGSA